MRVKLLSIFETRFTYIIQKFLELPSLLRQLSVIIYSERSGARGDSAARNRRTVRRALGESPDDDGINERPA